MKKTNKNIIVALVALLAIGGAFVYNQYDNWNVAALFAKQAEPVVARMDLSTNHTDKALFEVYVNDELQTEAAWMPKFGTRGVVIQKEGTNEDFAIKVLADATIKIRLRGPDVHDENNQIIEKWVTFTSLTINGEEILDEETAVWHNKPFSYDINAKAGETYTVSAKWQ